MASERAPAGGRVRAPWLARTTSPLHFVIALAGGALLQRMLGLPLPEGRWLTALHLLGTLLANAGLLLALACFALFLRRRTTILPAELPSRLIVAGPYRFTRNPLYLSLALSYAGLACILDVPWALLLLPAPLLILQRVVIPFEESRLRAQFGTAYADYCASVGRWW
ncbi:isoprenylcysteine carboxylmethyltransferase family protein [Luteimonas sp. BDR2-5]|uniref:methyltransferase family protein n=1 Tax=Proluteimonas luteida TaxID=2878685 RepID=UPI001E5127DF|nr:isoprenylcysteine carboxylmethyltransferase family protein [Luteimonas sp. BDR2-5]MCD9027341.1 isoprenylcysteine carboxylmethyltransferase family protein [Luteimonas sp. BDR2-5]